MDHFGPILLLKVDLLAYLGVCVAHPQPLATDLSNIESTLYQKWFLKIQFFFFLLFFFPFFFLCV